MKKGESPRAPQSLRLRWTKNNRLDASGQVEHQCPRCHQWFTATIEHFHRKGAGRLHTVCKVCASADSRAWYAQAYPARPRARPERAPTRDETCDLATLDAAMRGLGRSA